MITHVQTHVSDALGVDPVLETARAHVAGDVACNVQVGAVVAVRMAVLENVLGATLSVQTVPARAPHHAIQHALLLVVRHALLHAIRHVRPHAVRSVVTNVVIDASLVAMPDVYPVAKKTAVLHATVTALENALEKRNLRLLHHLLSIN